MHFSEYVAGMTPDAQQALTNDLTIGLGRVTLAGRLHQRDPRTLTMLATLAGGYAVLRAALTALGGDADDPLPPESATPVAALPEHWAAIVAPARTEALSGLLQIAVEMARDAVLAATEDADVSTVRGLLHDTLDVLITVRDETLCTA